MDPITQAIVLGIAGNLATDAVKAAYNKLKDAFIAKYGEASELVEAVNKLEKTPGRDDRKATVQAEVKEVQADQDPELLKLAQDLLNQLKEQPDGIPTINQTVSNVKYAATSGTGSATVSQINDNAPAEDWKK
jgi:hypothetical protein